MELKNRTVKICRTMDRSVIQQRLAETEQRIVSGDRYIAQHSILVAGLGRVDKLNPDSDAGKQHEGGEALDQLVVAGGDTA